jgi:DNA-binding IclR family transcriptional regulator
VLLTFADGRKIGDLSLEAFTERTITSTDELRSELEGVRRNGWATSVDEFEEGLHGVAVPVFDASGSCRAALSVAGPSYRMSRSRLSELAERCKEAAMEIGTRLGREHDES